MTREEAINKVQQMSLPKETMEIFQALAPELAASEDEKIKKELINQIEKSRHHPADKARWIAYLEKQKEYVSNNFDDVWDEEDCEEIIAEGQKLTPRFKELLKEVCHAWYDRGAKLEKQKSGLSFVGDFQAKTLQGPIELAEWKEAAKIREWILAKMQELAATGVPCSDEIKMADKAIDYLIKQKEYIEEPKIAFGDWGDKEKREAIITCLKYMRFVKKITNQEYDDLIKWLDNNYVKVEQKPVEKHDLLAQLREHLANTPKEQLEAEWKELEKWNNIGPTVKEYFHRIMPAEWSEEDELHRNFIMESLESQIRFQKKDVKGAHYTKQIRTTQNWLKSLSERFNLQPAEWSEKYIADVFEKVGLAKIVREQGNDGLTNALQAAMIELSKVRTTEWNEEDKEMLGKVLECIRFAEDRYQLEEEGTNGISVKLWLIDHIIPQQKQEWSEEDKKMCNNILNVLTPYLVYDGTYTRTTFGKKYKYGSEIRWIKSLPERFNIQPKQEWSEEDEKDMAHIIRILDDCYVYGTHDLSKTDRENLVNKLKSLRPSWKPSEQEKGALRTAIYVLTEERNFPKTAANLQAILDAFNGEESRKEWKPSEEQMDALKHLVEYVAPSEKFIVIIKNLYDDLKKL